MATTFMGLVGLTAMASSASFPGITLTSTFGGMGWAAALTTSAIVARPVSARVATPRPGEEPMHHTHVPSSFWPP